MNIHFIAIGGAAMHNLAIALKKNGHQVTGSDDQIFEPSRSRLASHGLLPAEEGWHPARLEGADAVILGMHARKDNPELQKALELGIKVYSYPEFIYEESRNKTRVVVAGSHGKTTITSMILHVLKKLDMDFDYLVGAQIRGFETMVRLSDAPIIVLEGDEYLSSPIDPRPKFHLYHPQIALISGIAWDHINVFPTWDSYVEQFASFIERLEEGSRLIFCEQDEALDALVKKTPNKCVKIPYHTPPYIIREGRSYLAGEGREYPLSVFGEHNLQNLAGARAVCLALGIPEQSFNEAIIDFTGASRRLEEVSRNEDTIVYKDFAHSPSKLDATVKAVKQQWPGRRLVACMELHTFSSLTKEFLKEYRGTMDAADEGIVYFDEKTITHKKLDPISHEEVRRAFDRDDLIVLTETGEVEKRLRSHSWKDTNLLMMSSGNFGGMDVEALGRGITS